MSGGGEAQKGCDYDETALQVQQKGGAGCFGDQGVLAVATCACVCNGVKLNELWLGLPPPVHIYACMCIYIL